MLLYFIYFIYFISNYVNSVNGGDLVSISSSCNTKTKNGLYYIKPLIDGSIIPVICNSGYTMIDLSLNLDSYIEYFTSSYQYGDDERAMYGTDCSDSGGWRDWFIPANENTKFRVSLGCQECKEGGIYGDNTAYYMSNGYFCPVDYDSDGCVNANFDIDLIENPMCNICDDTEGLCGNGHGRDGETITDSQSYNAWCDCYTLQLTADHRTVNEHADYCQGILIILLIPVCIIYFELYINR